MREKETLKSKLMLKSYNFRKIYAFDTQNYIPKSILINLNHLRKIFQIN
jgi:hypothetical protein